MQSPVFPLCRPPAGLNPSGAAEPDRHLFALHYYRHFACAAGCLQHLRQGILVILYVKILVRCVSPGKVVPGSYGVGSAFFAVNNNFLQSKTSPF